MAALSNDIIVYDTDLEKGESVQLRIIQPEVVVPATAGELTTLVSMECLDLHR